MPASEDYGPLSALKQYLDYRPLGNDPWTNTMRGTAPAPGQGFAPAGADPVLYPTASPLVNITEGDIKRATDVGLAASGGGLKGQQIKAYHSSPHDFDKFDLSKIGTGEGAQVYGHGLYLAENPAVSGQGGQYWDQFKNRFSAPEIAAANQLKRVNFNRDKAVEQVEGMLNASRIRAQGSPGTFHQEAIKNYQDQLDLLRSGKPVGPRTYEVNINADPAHMLDWDKPLREQSQLQRDAARKLGMLRDEYTGSEVYKTIAMNRRAEGASSALAEAGIPGIKYLDEGSRDIARQRDALLKQQSMPMTADQIMSGGPLRPDIHRRLAELPQETSNYVVFDPTILDIVKKYGLTGLASAPALTSSLRDRENTP